MINEINHLVFVFSLNFLVWESGYRKEAPIVTVNKQLLGNHLQTVSVYVLLKFWEKKKK